MAATKKVSILLSGKETVSTAANKAAGSMDDLGNRGKSAFEGLGGAIVVANQAMELVGRTVGAAIQRMTELVDIYTVQEQAERKLAAVIRATGQAAGFTAGDMETMASSLQDVTTFGDEAILGMQSMLLTFKSIQGDALERTTELALDLSAAFGQDLQSSALQLGKALEDPKTGLTALRR
ncbi:MAG: phage tail length tape measure family protein, partial [Chloroflexota bacterium]|nr:phage tail length tape measure family protein [Chloroflexota bacterium]